ncbi:polysaccharide biosynthesis/export family protein [Pseudoroseicyclus aestuarii]|uniref:Polysaccharide export outer membrane protein n=1 Tax=Pseudoroseicyclus aestuarii TaxID=1795041 RepID=A0A318SSC5_9RHOB|nr:polysaccharide biosynthesis/export family protein [Pseudoroseicyclus aestuarii]PYE82162.1 polysaccharide export outer membrane protein [Pseudoroseicyclus aestuarii]
MVFAAIRPGKLLSLLVLMLGLAGCATLPRGAGLEREVLRQPRSVNGEAVPADFTIAPVTRALLPAYAAWPAVGEERLPWIERVDQPNQRIIAPGDTVSVTVWTTESNGLLTAGSERFAALPNMRVSSSGTIFLPYVGTVTVSGMAPETARARIEERYAEVSPSAQVQFEFTEGRQNRVSLVGGVAQPGPYPLPDQDFTVMGLIALGGGVSQGLPNPQIRLQRGGRIYGTSVERLLETPRLDTTLAGGDMIYVEADDRTFLSLGAAGTEAMHRFNQDEITAIEAMAMIGGLSDFRADPKGILILRQYPPEALRPSQQGPQTERMIFTLDLTSADGLFSAGEFLIRPDDVIYVTESPITSVRTVFGLVGNVFGLVNAAPGN